MDKAELIELVKQMQGGDQQAFSDIYDEFADRLYKFIRIKVASTEQAEDLLQETFVKAWQGCRQLRTDELNFSAWLYRIAANTVADHYRKVYRRPQTVELSPDMNMPALDSTEQLTESGFDVRDIHKALDELPPHYRQVIELRFFQEFSIEETSKVLKKSSVTVRVLQHRATKKLEQIFKSHEQGFKKFI